MLQDWENYKICTEVVFNVGSSNDGINIGRYTHKS